MEIEMITFINYFALSYTFNSYAEIYKQTECTLTYTHAHTHLFHIMYSRNLHTISVDYLKLIKTINLIDFHLLIT